MQGVCVRATGCQAECIIQVYHFLWWWVKTETWQNIFHIFTVWQAKVCLRVQSYMSRESDVHDIWCLRWWLTGWVTTRGSRLKFGHAVEKNKLSNSCVKFMSFLPDPDHQCHCYGPNTVTMAAVADAILNLFFSGLKCLLNLSFEKMMRSMWPSKAILLCNTAVCLHAHRVCDYPPEVILPACLCERVNNLNCCGVTPANELSSRKYNRVFPPLRFINTRPGTVLSLSLSSTNKNSVGLNYDNVRAWWRLRPCYNS